MNIGILSDLFGWTSIGCWLFAQFPQVLENIRRQSCDGLALPFLLNWLLGDITNLIGCVLTHQLPFQTILASYFVTVDFMLFSQYFYYQPRGIAAQSVTRAPPDGEHYSRHHYRALSTAAAGVAIAAAFAASEQETGVPGVRRRTTSASATRQDAEVEQAAADADEADDSFDVNALGALTESIHSDSGRHRNTWSAERGGSLSRPRPRLHSSLIMSPTDERAADMVAGRGRPRERQVISSPIEMEIDLEGQPIIHGRGVTGSGSTVRERMSSRASKRSVGLVFLGVWALFGFGSLSNTAGVQRRASDSTGIVLSAIPKDTNLHSYPIHDIASERQFHDIQVPDIPLYTAGDEESFSERVIGRIFAWMCTTLYLTSRLPQIWKNFRRKSVEGLSMYLFVFAFLGNVFYVLSILSSPHMTDAPRSEATTFLLESFPYLLGSGGTLLFDITIVTQSFLYRPRPARVHSITRLQRPVHGLAQSYSYSSYTGDYPKHRVHTRARSYSSAAVPPSPISAQLQQNQLQAQASVRARSQSATRGRAQSHPHLHSALRTGSGGVQTVPEEAQPLLAWPTAGDDGDVDHDQERRLFGADDGMRARDAGGWAHRRRDTLSTDGGTDPDSPT